jgi:hypothetical protein
VQAVLDSLSPEERAALDAVWAFKAAPHYYYESRARRLASEQTGVSEMRIAQIRGRLSGAVIAAQRRIKRERQEQQGD